MTAVMCADDKASLCSIAACFTHTAELKNGGRPTYGVDEHSQAPEGSDGICKMLFGIIKLLDVTANLLHHDLTLFCFAPNFIDFPKQLLDLKFTVI